MKKYSQAYTIAFEADTQDEAGEGISSEEMLAAIIAAATGLHEDGELLSAVGAPFDTYQKEVR